MSIHMYNFTLQNPGAVTHSMAGNFADPKASEILVARGHILELLRLESNHTMQTILSTEVFGVIRSLATFRLHGTHKDYIVIGSDSGKISIVEYLPDRNAFVKVHEEAFGRSGARRIVPGQYLAVDPSGRAAMIGAIEKQKFVYILNRDNQAKLTISSPLEAHKSHTILYDLVGVDVGYANPLFAAIEMDYSESDLDSTGQAASSAQKYLTWYELDLGLNHVVRKSSDVIDRTSHRLICVPGGTGFPSGVLICAKSAVYYRDMKGKTFKANIPRRLHTLMTNETGSADDGVLTIAHTMYRHDADFWFLIQTEHGDLFYVFLQRNGEEVQGITAQYLDTVPPASSITLSSHYLHVFAEVGNHYLYNVIGVPSPDEDVTFNAPSASSNGMEVDHASHSEQPNGSTSSLYFKPRSFKYLQILDEMQSLSPILDIKVDQAPNEDSPQILALCGSGPRSTLRILKHGVQVNPVAVSPLPNAATAIWALKTSSQQEFDQYIVVSFPNTTLVLSVGESVRELEESDPLYRCFLDTTSTMAVGRLSDDTFVQVHPGGIRHIRSNLSNQELPCPSDRKVVHACLNERQVVLALNGTNNNLIYYETDNASKLSSPHSFSVGGEILAMAIQSVPQNRQRAKYLAVAIADDKGSKIHLYSLDPAELMQTVSVQVLSWRVSSLSLIQLGSNAPNSVSTSSQLILGVGASNGVFSRYQVDQTTGELSDARDKALGSRAVKLFNVKIPGGQALVAVSSRVWILYHHQSTLRMMPLSYSSFDFASSFHSEYCMDGIVCVSGPEIRIISPDGYGRTFNQREVPLNYTPRQSCIHPITKNILIVESDHNATPIEQRTKAQAEMTTLDAENGILPASMFGAPKPGPRSWGSCIRLVDVEQGKTLDLITLDNNEAAVSICVCSFRDHGGEWFICVGTAKDLVLQPKRSCSAAYIHVYSLVDHGRKLQLLHKKQVEDIPGALATFQHRLLAGVGKSLKIFDLGKKKPQLLRKCENNGFPNHIVSISTTRERIIVGDIQESVHFVKYSRPDSLTIFADDTTPRWMTSQDVLDYNTVAGSDKFGNVFILRLPEKVAQVESDSTGKASPWSQGVLGGAAHKLEVVCSFYVGETVTRVQKIKLTPGGSEFLLYVTVHGTMGALLPLTSRGSVDFFSQLELYMRQENAPLCGRDHLAYRSSYFPVKNVVDGDLIEQFSSIHVDKQRTIADNLEQSIADIQRKIEDVRSLI